MGKTSNVSPSAPQIFQRIDFTKSSFTAIDCFIVFILTIFSIFIRFWKLGYPERVIYDEVTFGNFATFYFKPYFYCGIKPNLHQIILSFVLYLGNYKNSIIWDKEIGSLYLNSDTDYVFFRLIICLFSSFIVPLLYLSARILNFSYCSSILASLFICLDMSSIISSKFILPDGLNQLAACIHLFSLCLLLKYQSNKASLFVGFTLGLAISCKFTFLSLLLFDFVVCLFYFRFSRTILFTFEISLSAYFIMNLIFVGHYFYTQSEDSNFLMLMQYKYQLIIHSIRSIIFKISNIFKYHFNQFQGIQRRIICVLDFINVKLLHLQKWISIDNQDHRIFGQSANIQSNQSYIDSSLYTRRHRLFNNYNSDPILWPFLFEEAVTLFSMPTPDLYDSKYKTKDDQTISIRLIGSPVSYWISTFGIFLTILLIPFNVPDYRNFIFIFGWISTYFPFLFDSRLSYMTNYLVPLAFSSLNFAALIDNIGKKTHLRRQISSFLAASCVLLALICFIYFYPWIMGTPCHECETNLLWLKRWKEYSYKPIDFSVFRAYNMTKVMRDDSSIFT